MGDTRTDTAAADLLESVARAIAEAASCRTVEPVHRSQARAALDAIEAAGSAILPRPAGAVRRTLGDAVSRAEAGSGPSAADGGGGIRAARQWLDRLGAVLDQMPEG